MLGDELRRAREEAGLTQEELAERAGIHRTYVSLLERDKKSPTIAVLFRLCRAVGVQPTTFIARVEAAETEPTPPGTHQRRRGKP
jgi:transcriptional regulator with XRE-family HTH domain